MSFMSNILSKSAVAAMAVGAMFAFGAPTAEAATVVDNVSGPYDILSDDFFFGTVETGGSSGAGSYSIDFTSSVDPVSAIANASVTVLVGGLFNDLKAEWVNTDTTALLASVMVTAPSVSLTTLFGAPNLNQSLVFSWTSAHEDAGFDFDVSAVPLPAGGLLLLTALGGVAVLRRKRKAA